MAKRHGLALSWREAKLHLKRGMRLYWKGSIVIPRTSITDATGVSVVTVPTSSLDLELRSRSFKLFCLGRAKASLRSSMPTV
jgi:hypothetical protein